MKSRIPKGENESMSLRDLEEDGVQDEKIRETEKRKGSKGWKFTQRSPSFSRHKSEKLYFFLKRDC